MPVHADTKLNIHQREVEASKCGHTLGLQPLSLFPWISGNEKIISLPTISLPTWQANQCPWLLELCWLFAKGTGTDQMTDIKQFYQCSLNFFLIRKNVRNKLVSHKEWANSLAEHLTLCRHPFFCFVLFSHVICCPKSNAFLAILQQNKISYLFFLYLCKTFHHLPEMLLVLQHFFFSSEQNESTNINLLPALGLPSHVEHTTHCWEAGYDMAKHTGTCLSLTVPHPVPGMNIQQRSVGWIGS